MINETGWSKDDNPFTHEQEKSSRFFPILKDGDSKVLRFLADINDKENFKTCYKHRVVKNAGGQNCGDFICLNSKENLQKGVVCPLCEKGLNATARFATAVIDRTDGKAKIFEQGRQIYGQLLTYSNENGDITEVDFKYAREGSGQFDTKYTIVPLIKTVAPLKEEEKAMIETFDLDLLVAEKTREEIIALVGGREKPAPKAKAKPAQSTTQEDLASTDLPF